MKTLRIFHEGIVSLGADVTLNDKNIQVSATNIKFEAGKPVIIDFEGDLSTLHSELERFSTHDVSSIELIVKFEE